MEEKRLFFEELFEYSRQKNHELIEVFLKNEKSVPDFSLKLFSHILNAHHIWNHRMLGEINSFGPWELHPVSAFAKINEDNLKESLMILYEIELGDQVDYKNSKGDFFGNSVRDILFHIINHSTYHRGQIAMDFRQKGLEPLVSDYIFYKR